MKTKQKIVRIKEIYKIESFKIFCLFNNNEFRYIDFEMLFKNWKINEKDVEYKLLNIDEFKKVELFNGVLTWKNVSVSLLDEDFNEKEFPYEIDPITLYENSFLGEEKIL